MSRMYGTTGKWKTKKLQQGIIPAVFALLTPLFINVIMCGRRDKNG